MSAVVRIPLLPDGALLLEVPLLAAVPLGELVLVPLQPASTVSSAANAPASRILICICQIPIEPSLVATRILDPMSSSSNLSEHRDVSQIRDRNL